MPDSTVETTCHATTVNFDLAMIIIACFFQIEKNQVLTDENKKLKEKCSNLEELLSEEETDISDVLELIRTMQTTGAKNGANIGPISPISAVAAKLRGNYK